MTTPLSLSSAAGAADLPNAVFTDLSSLNALRTKAEGSTEEQDAGQLEEAARQFSSIFLHMALKSMRDASFGGGLLDSQQSEFYRDMFDQQLALDLSSADGFGMTQLIVQQLSPDTGVSSADEGAETPTANLANKIGEYSKVAQAETNEVTFPEQRAQ